MTKQTDMLETLSIRITLGMKHTREECSGTITTCGHNNNRGKNPKKFYVYSLCKIKFCSEMLHGFHKQLYYLKNNRATCLWFMWNLGLVLSFWRSFRLSFIFNYLVNWRIPKKDYFVPLRKISILCSIY